jgi:hypothetical protein
MAALVCPEGSEDLVTGRNLTKRGDPTVVRLRGAGNTVECFDLETIYGMAREAVALNTPFISPYTRTPYTAADRMELERVRAAYVASKPAELANYPSLEDLVAGETTLEDAASAIEEIGRGNLAERARLDRILARGIITKTTRNLAGETLYYYAIVAGLPDLVTRFKTPSGFLTTARGYTPFLLACDMRNFSIIKLVAPDRADREAINAVIGSEGAPAPVVVAAAYTRKDESVEIMEWLFTTYGYDINIADNNGNSSLIVAISNNNLPLFAYLLAHGADVNLLTKSYDSPLKLAAQEGDQEMVRRLLARGAKMYINDKTGESAFSIAQARAAVNSPRRPQYAAVVEMLRAVPAEHIDGVNRPNNFVQIAPAERARRIAAIAAAQRRGVAPKPPPVLSIRNRQRQQEAVLQARRDAAAARRGVGAVAVRQLRFPGSGSGRKTRRRRRKTRRH